jgi:hypothetical protein
MLISLLSHEHCAQDHQLFFQTPPGEHQAIQLLHGTLVMEQHLPRHLLPALIQLPTTPAGQKQSR